MGKKGGTKPAGRPPDSAITAETTQKQRGHIVWLSVVAAVGVAWFFAIFSPPSGAKPTAYARILPVPRLDASVPGSVEEFFLRYHGRLPVLIEGSLRDWPAMAWTPESLAEKCPAAQIRLKTYDTEARDWALLREVGQVPFREYLAEDFRHGELREDARYGLEMVLRTECPEALEDIRIPAFFADDLLTRFFSTISWPTLIVGPKGSRSGLHRDSFNLPFYMALFYGRKRWRIFLNDEEALNSYYNTEFQSFVFDPFDPDFAAFPNLGRATVYEHDLQPGELLYIPPGAPHAAFNLQDAIAISGNYLDPRGVPFHANFTCTQQASTWNTSKLWPSFCNLRLLQRQRPRPLESFKELSFYNLYGHKSAKEWCDDYLRKLRLRAAQGPEHWARNLPIVDSYCRSRGSPEKTLLLPEVWSDGRRLLEATSETGMYRVLFSAPYLRGRDHQDLDPSLRRTLDSDVVKGVLTDGWLEVVVHERQGFTLSISIEGSDVSTYGLELHDSSDGALVVADIRRGAVADWNLEHPDVMVQVGDRILSVNGATGADDMRGELRKLGEKTIVLKRPDVG